MHRRSHFPDERSLFFNSITHHYDIGAGLAVEIGFLRVADTAADDERDLDMAGDTGDHFFTDRITGAAAGVHIDQLHAQHLPRHRRTKGNFVLLPLPGPSITNVT